MLEIIVALGIIAFIYAYLYSKSPDPRTASGFTFRLLFLSMCLWTVYLLVWVGYNANTMTTVTKYDNFGNITGTEVWNTTLSQPVRKTMLAYLGVSTWIPYVVIALILVFLIYNTFVSVLNKRE